MRKNVFGRQFKRDKNERKALFKGLISSLVLHGRIETTEDKAKAIKADVDKIITKAKKGEAIAKNLLQRQLPQKEIEIVIHDIAPRFNGRQGGYTRIIRIGRRFSDNAQMVLMEWTVTKIKDQSFDPLRPPRLGEAGSEASRLRTKIKNEDKRPATT